LKRILILANNAGGLYNFRIELVCELIKQNYGVYFAVPQPQEHNKVQQILATGAKYIHTPMNRRGTNPLEDLKLVGQYKKIMKSVDPDLVLTYTIKPNIYGTFVANKFNKPVVMNITGIGSSLAAGKLKHIIKRMYKYVCRRARVVFFQNRGNHGFFVENGIVNKNISRLIPGSGVNIDKFTPLAKTRVDDVIRYLYIGRIMKEKGIEEYLEAAAKVTDRYPQTEFQILGSFEEEQYKRLVLYNENKKINYLGRSEDVRKEIREVDCIVHPSYHEGMSNVLLEGAAMGKPLLASNIPGCKEIIKEGYNGFLFNKGSVQDLKEKLLTFINLDHQTRLDMGKNSRKKVVKEFDRNIVIKAYLDEINNIL
jgi:glycosyltransferase involved in cell wall biosynthesis